MAAVWPLTSCENYLLVFTSGMQAFSFVFHGVYWYSISASVVPIAKTTIWKSSMGRTGPEI